MQEIELIPVTLNGDYIEVHPTALEDHKRIGWVQCQRQEQAEEDAPVKRGRKPKDAE